MLKDADPLAVVAPVGSPVGVVTVSVVGLVGSLAVALVSVPPSHFQSNGRACLPHCITSFFTHTLVCVFSKSSTALAAIVVYVLHCCGISAGVVVE